MAHSELYIISVDDQDSIMSNMSSGSSIMRTRQKFTFMLEQGLDLFLAADSTTMDSYSHSHFDDDSTMESSESDFSMDDSDIKIFFDSSKSPAPQSRRPRLEEEMEELTLRSLEQERSSDSRQQESIVERPRRHSDGPLEVDSLHLSRSRVPLRRRVVRRTTEQQQNEEDVEDDDEEFLWAEGEISIIPLASGE